MYATGGNAIKPKTRLQVALSKALKLLARISSFNGRANRQIGTMSKAPISAVAKLMTDMRDKPMNVVDIVTDFKLAHSPLSGRDGAASKIGVSDMKYKIRRLKADNIPHTVKFVVGVELGI
jgi:hypothetical protein